MHLEGCQPVPSSCLETTMSTLVEIPYFFCQQFFQYFEINKSKLISKRFFILAFYQQTVRPGQIATLLKHTYMDCVKLPTSSFPLKFSSIFSNGNSQYFQDWRLDLHVNLNNVQVSDYLYVFPSCCVKQQI